MSTAPTRPPSRSIAWGWVLLFDAVVLLVFASVGRRSHDEGNAITGVLVTAWPFLVAAGFGHLINLAALRRPPSALVAGVVVWVCTVAGGMLLRHLADRGTAFSFIVVATTFTGVFMLGWRAAAAWRIRR